MNRFISFICLLQCLLLSHELYAGDKINGRLFHIERSKNKNIVCYDVVVNSKGKLDSQNPVNVYWINREESFGKQDKLSYIQQKSAYGYSIIEQNEKTANIVLNACKDKVVEIVKTDDSYIAKTLINKQKCVLTKIYVKTLPTNSLKVEYVELYGVDSKNKSVSERIYN